MLQPAVSEILITELSKPLTVETQKLVDEWRSNFGSAEKALLLCPLVVQDNHWVLLTARKRSATEAYELRYYDSLPKPGSQTLREKASKMLQVLRGFLEQIPDSLPPTEFPVTQKDGWSCGFHVLNRCEEAYREYRGENYVRVATQPDARRVILNTFLGHLLK